MTLVSAGGILSLELIAIDWGYENELTYAYSLSEKSDNINWIDLKSDQNLSFQKLRPGTSKLLIRAQNNAGKSEPVILEVEFLPFWWQSLLFRIILLVVTVALVVFIFYARKQRFLKREAELEMIIREKTLEVINEKEELRHANIELSKQNEIKEALLQEIHHRVKNNMQIVSSIIDMQTNSLRNEKDKSVLSNIQVRINSMSLVHELLYAKEDVVNLYVKEYLQKLALSTLEIIESNVYDVKINTFIEDIQMNISDCIFLGLLASEAISNSIKHVFSSTEKPQIEILFNSDTGNKIINYVIRDNGCGFSNNKAKQRQNSLGIRLIRIYAKQLNADLTTFNDHGAVIRLIIPIKNLKTEIG